MGTFDVVLRVLDEDNWNYEVVEDQHMLLLRMTGEGGSWKVIIRVDDDGVVAVHSVLEQFAPESRRSEVIDLLTRINWNARLGAFQFDHSDGEMRLHSAIDVEGGDLTGKMFTNLLWTNLSTMNRYYGALMAVCFAKVDAVSALLALEVD